MNASCRFRGRRSPKRSQPPRSRQRKLWWRSHRVRQWGNGRDELLKSGWKRWLQRDHRRWGMFSPSSVVKRLVSCRARTDFSSVLWFNKSVFALFKKVLRITQHRHVLCCPLWWLTCPLLFSVVLCGDLWMVSGCLGLFPLPNIVVCLFILALEAVDP